MNTIGIASIVAAVFLGLTTLVYTAYSKRQDRQDMEISEVQKSYNRTQLDVNTIQVDVKHIKGDIADSKLIQQKIFDKIDKLEK